MSLPSEYEKQRDEAAENYPRVYEIKYMNADTPRLSGSEYLQHGFKAGSDWANARAEKEISKLINSVNEHIEARAEYRKRIVELEEKLKACDESEKVYIKKLQSQEKQVQGLVEALEFYNDVSYLIEQCPQYCPEFSDVAMRALSNYKAAKNDQLIDNDEKNTKQDHSD